MVRKFIHLYSTPILLSVTGFIALIFPFVAYGFIAGMGWDFHKSFWFASISYGLMGLSAISVLLPFANLFFLIRFGLNEPKELKSHFVNFTCFLINLLGAFVFGSVAYVMIRYS